MKLAYDSDQPYISIHRFNPIKLKPFSILTGLNGSGKTHLLSAIKGGYIEIEDLDPDEDIVYYNYTDFMVKNSSAANGQQLRSKRDNAFKFLQGQKVGTIQGANAIQISRSNFDRHFDEKIQKEIHDIHDFNIFETPEDKGYSQELVTAINAYCTQIRQSVFGNANFRKNPDRYSILEMIEKLGKPIHLLTIEEVRENYRPSLDDRDLLSNYVGNHFFDHAINRYIAISDTLEDEDNQKTRSEIAANFDQLNPNPWDDFNRVLDLVHKSGNRPEVFNFRVTDPTEIILKRESYRTAAFNPMIVDRESGNPRTFESLSSGEKVLFALVLTMYKSKTTSSFPKLLLLDEIDATLHPSMIDCLLTVLDDVFVTNGTNVILATHSPTTVAFADPESLFIVNHGPAPNKVQSVTKEYALSLVSEGFITLGEGIKIIDQLSNENILIITEGKNNILIAKALKLFNKKGVEVFTGADSKSGKDQLKILYQFIRKFEHNSKVLFVMDTDVGADKCWPAEENNTYYYILPKNNENKKIIRGIENMFSEKDLENFMEVNEKKDARGNLIRSDYSIPKNQKTRLAKYLCESGTKVTFKNFAPLMEKLEGIEK